MPQRKTVTGEVLASWMEVSPHEECVAHKVDITVVIEVANVPSPPGLSWRVAVIARAFVVTKKSYSSDRCRRPST